MGRLRTAGKSKKHKYMAVDRYRWTQAVTRVVIKLLRAVRRKTFALDRIILRIKTEESVVRNWACTS
jgi:hypothetical protein